MWRKVKNVLGVLAVPIAILAFVTLGLVLIAGAVWLGEAVYEWLTIAGLVTFWITLLVLFPLSFVRRTRGFSAISILIASYLFGVYLWVTGLLLTYHIWGLVAVIIGLLVFGVGVVPIAMLATAVKGMWPTFGELVILVLIVYGLRWLSHYLVEKVERDSALRMAYPDAEIADAQVEDES